MTGTNVKCFEVSDEQIANLEVELPNTVKLVRNIMKIHQERVVCENVFLAWCLRGRVVLVSCFEATRPSPLGFESHER